MKIKLRVGRNTFNIGDNDVVLDNGSCFIIVTQEIIDGNYYALPKISKSKVKELRRCGFIYTNESLKESAINEYEIKDFCFYKFNIELMAENGYEVVEE